MRATWIIIQKKQILLMHRICGNKDYYVLPGWWVEKWENLEETVIREMKEETNLDCSNIKKLWGIKDERDLRTHYFFLIKDFKWEIKLGWPEAEINSKANQYILEWHNINKIRNLLVYPNGIQEKIINKFDKTRNI